MAFDPAPSSFFGPQYHLDDNTIKFPLLGAPGPFGGHDFYVAVTNLDELLVLSDAVEREYYTVGSKIRIGDTGTVPTGIANGSEYWIIGRANVSGGVYLSLSATEGGAQITGFADGVYTAKVFTLNYPASLPKLTNADADETTGDWRVVAFALLDYIADQFQALQTADKPARFTCSKKTTGSDDVMVRAYSFSMNLTLPDPAAETILDE